jgi:hypothetical protein
MPFKEILRCTKKVDPEETAELRESIFLTREEPDELLGYVGTAAIHPYIYPMFVFCGHTGGRRSGNGSATSEWWIFAKNS